MIEEEKLPAWPLLVYFRLCAYIDTHPVLRCLHVSKPVLVSVWMLGLSFDIGIL